MGCVIKMLVQYAPRDFALTASMRTHDDHGVLGRELSMDIAHGWWVKRPFILIRLVSEEA